MKQKLLKGLLCVAAAGALGACSDDLGKDFETEDAKGKITLTTTIDCSLENSRSRVEYDEVMPENLSITLTSDNGSYVQTWESLADFPTNQLFPVGGYTLEASYGDKDTEGFASPYYYGSASFKVEENETSVINLTATLANALLDVRYTDNFTDYMVQYSAEVHSAGGDYFEYPSEETRPIYTKAGDVEVFVEFTKPNGQQAKMSVAEFLAEPRHFYHVTVDVSNDGSGTASLVVAFDDGLEEMEYDIDISDDVLNAPAPEITPVGFEPGTAIEIIGTNTPAGPIGFDIIAYGGLKSATLSTRSTSLLNQGWPAEINLVGTDLSTLEALGFASRGLGKPDKMAVVTLTDVLPHIYYIEGDNNNEFTLTVKDACGKVSETPVTLTVTALPVTLEIDNIEYYMGETVVEFDLLYNGGDFSQYNLQYYYEGTGRYINLTDPQITKTENGVYHVIGGVRLLNQSSSIKAIVGGITAEKEFTPIAQVTHDTATPANVFAKYAYIPVSVNGSDISKATVWVSANGNDYTMLPTTVDAEHNLLKVEGLNPGLDYSFKIQNGDRSVNYTLERDESTEEAIQLENGDFEAEWPTSSKTNALMSVTVYSLPGWETLNDYTTDYLSAGTYYSALSSTIPENSGHNGKAALIRSVGFDFSAASSGLNNPKKYSQGELYLGQYAGNGTPSYGIDFESRPSSLSFYYKYAPVNSDNKGYAEITVFDNNNNIITKNSVNLEKADDYSLVTLDLNYDFSSAKAAKASVVFRSTYDPSSFLNSSDIPKPRTVLGILADYYIGSKLYIDDVVLNY